MLAVRSSSATTRAISGLTSVMRRNGMAAATAISAVTPIVMPMRRGSGLPSPTPIASTSPQRKPTTIPPAAGSRPPIARLYRTNNPAAGPSFFSVRIGIDMLDG